MKKNPIEPDNRRLPPLNWGEYQIMQKIGSSNGITRYELAKYAEKLEDCEKPFKNYHKIDKLVKYWKKHGLVSVHRIHEKYPLTLCELTDEGKEYLKRLDDWFGYPFS